MIPDILLFQLHKNKLKNGSLVLGMTKINDKSSMFVYPDIIS